MSIEQFVRLYHRQLNKKRKTLRAKREGDKSSESEFTSEDKKVAKREVKPRNAKRAAKASK